jgi:hypothetical protein
MFFSTIGLTGSVTLEQYKIYRVRFMVLTPLSTIFHIFVSTLAIFFLSNKVGLIVLICFLALSVGIVV